MKDRFDYMFVIFAIGFFIISTVIFIVVDIMLVIDKNLDFTTKTIGLAICLPFTILLGFCTKTFIEERNYI